MNALLTILILSYKPSILLLKEKVYSLNLNSFFHLINHLNTERILQIITYFSIN